MNRTLQQLGLDRAAVHRAVLLHNTARESTPRTLAVMSKQRYGRKGLPQVLRDQMYADYRRLGSIAANAPIYARSPKSVKNAPQAYGIGWMSSNGLKEAIPPAYTRHIGEAARRQNAPHEPRRTEGMD